MCDCNFYNKLASKLSSCLTKHNYKYPGKTKTISCKENGAKFTCRIESNEIGCLFTVDPQYKGNCKRVTKNSSYCLDSEKSCDFVLFVRTIKANGSSEVSKEVLKNVVFIELKGNKVNEAIKQIKETIKAFKRKFSKNSWHYRILAVIIFTGSVPRLTQDRELKNLVDKFPFLKAREHVDISGYVKN